MSWENEVEDYTDKDTVAIVTGNDYLCNTVGIGEEMMWESQQVYENGEGAVNSPNEERGFSGVYLLGQLHHTSSGNEV